ncbi:MAG: oxidoreductase [Candidatus Levybacteria bacterium]|nr:oxidoreductase [Candidatus Levybacteria bacterium]
MRLSFIDSFLNQITMYKLVMHGLLILSCISVLFGFLGVLSYSGFAMIETYFVVMTGVWVSHVILARFFKATTNVESYIITGMILFLILAPIASMTDVYITFVAGVLASVSKYLLAINKRHIFNPVAISLFLLGLFGFGNAIWWVGSAALLPFTLCFGLLVVRKIRRFHLFFSFALIAIPVLTFLNIAQGVSINESVVLILTSWPLLFFGSIMLTEPMTTPPTKKLYMSYGVLVGLLFSIRFELGPIYSSPELALVLGNIYSYLVGPKYKLFLSVISSKKIASNIYEFVFIKPKGFTYKAGQYLEWTLSHPKSDSRGVRRFFTIASSPTEETLKLGVRVDSESSSSFKRKLLSLTKDARIIATQLAGDFTLPNDPTVQMTFIAGGIGITPFRSMAAYLIDKKEKRDITLFYFANTVEDFVYRDIFTRAEAYGLKTMYVPTREAVHGESGRLTKDMLKKYTPNFAKRMYYLSGPNAMVEGYKAMLLSVGVQRKNIISDYFPGF